MASLQQLSHPRCVLFSYSCSMMFSGRRIPMRFSSSPLRKSGCQFTRLRSGSRGNDFVALISGASLDQIVAKVDEDTDIELLACPVCFRPLSRNGIPGLSLRAISASGFQCGPCKKSYSSRNIYLDLTITANAKEYSEMEPTGIALFRNPLVSYAYERGWRQRFAMSGFPGPDEEVKMAQEFFKPTFGGVLLDVSCGSGLFTRRFANLGLFSAVLALDFSESMLRQAYEYIQDDAALLGRTIGLVRADVARLPFATGSVGAVFAGAALHCWPSPSAGVAEISRILRPGGVFVATTFLTPPFPFALPNEIALEIRQIFRQITSGLRSWKASELEDLLKTCGLVNYQNISRDAFIMITAEKPE